ncbi:YitT family protein [Lysinibacillus sphaericus]|uniref:Uncharacterized protein n=1 Tax=Sporosarcina ureilytica TaxID=298596 RepID=A0A1D8JF82_9BACL|nr:hypothetical protein BI350_07355 [Sporosarcina ureilytica]
MEGKKVGDAIRQFALIIIGAALAGYALDAVLIPNSIIDGGVTGISIMGNRVFGIPLLFKVRQKNIPQSKSDSEDAYL